MRDFPTDPMRQHALSIEAFCQDLLAGDYHAPRMKAVCEISRQLNSSAIPPSKRGGPPAPEDS